MMSTGEMRKGRKTDHNSNPRHVLVTCKSYRRPGARRDARGKPQITSPLISPELAYNTVIDAASPPPIGLDIFLFQLATGCAPVATICIAYPICSSTLTLVPRSHTLGHLQVFQVYL